MKRKLKQTIKDETRKALRTLTLDIHLEVLRQMETNGIIIRGESLEEMKDNEKKSEERFIDEISAETDKVIQRGINAI